MHDQCHKLDDTLAMQQEAKRLHDQLAAREENERALSTVLSAALGTPVEIKTTREDRYRAAILETCLRLRDDAPREVALEILEKSLLS